MTNIRKTRTAIGGVGKALTLLLAVVCLLSINGCDKRRDGDSQRVYVYGESEEFIKPSITLFEDMKCQITFSVISSYLGAGTYTIDGDVLTVNTDDGEYRYTFRIDGEDMDRLIFDAENSSDNLHSGKFGDGAVFEYDGGGTAD